MKFFLSFLQSNAKYDIPAYGFWSYYIKNGIAEAGHTWAECPDADWALGLVPKGKHEQVKWREDIWEKTINWLKKNPADVFLSYLYPDQIETSAIKEIRKLGIPCVNFFCDHVRQFKKVPAAFGAFDLNWVPEYKAVAWYISAGYPYIHLPMPMWVQPENRLLRKETINQITFIGSRDIQRALLFEELISRNPEFPLVIYGSGWKDTHFINDPNSPGYSFAKRLAFNYGFTKDQGITASVRKIRQRSINKQIDKELLASKSNGMISFDLYNTLIGESMITLGVNRYPSYRFPLHRPATYSRLRDIEAPMLGACYLTEWTEGIDELYDLDNEIAVYRTTDQLIGKAQELTLNSDQRNRLRKNGQRRALDDHSIPQSLNKIIIRIKR